MRKQKNIAYKNKVTYQTQLSLVGNFKNIRKNYSGKANMRVAVISRNAV